MFYLLQAPSARTYQYAWKDVSFLGFQKRVCAECGRTAASMEYSGTHCLVAEGGAKYPDYLAFCGAGEPLFVISERAADVFRSVEISGVAEFTPVRVVREADGTLYPLPESAPHYVLARISGKIDLDYAKMGLKKKKLCRRCGSFEWNRQRMHPLYMDAGTWDGSDICRNESMPGYVVFSAAAVDVIKKHRLKGFGFEPLSAG